MTPVKARSDAPAGLTMASWTSCGPWRGSCSAAARLKPVAATEPRPTVAAKVAAERRTILVFFIDDLAWLEGTRSRQGDRAPGTCISTYLAPEVRAEWWVIEIPKVP